MKDRQIFSIGAGICDITGPAAEIGMMGYAMPLQRTSGIHMRLRSRAFVIVSPDDNRRVALVTADLCMIFQAVKQRVVEKLKERFDDLYTDDNVLLSATHTHSGPGGYSHYTLYNLTVLGFDRQNFEAITDGIYQSIVRAHINLGPCSIKIAAGDLPDASMNRAVVPYRQNPEEERSCYEHDTDKTMTLLRFERPDGKEIGMINWFAVHATNIGNTNRLITGDNKGYASYLFEKLKGTDYSAPETFVAAFAQSNSGDVTPNIWGYPDGIHDFQRMKIIGERQFNTAIQLYDSATDMLDGKVDYRHAYVDMSEVAIDPQWADGEQGHHTCKAAMGMSMLAGSTEDGKGLEFVQEGLIFDGTIWPNFTLIPDEQECHAEKVIVLPSGNMKPYPWSPEVLPVQVMSIGKLAIVAVPSECTTMSGRRLIRTVQTALEPDHTIIAGLSNAYSGYVTTREEYAVQQYEGASTHFGPYTLNAYQQEFYRLAVSLRDDTTLPPGPSPRNLSEQQLQLVPGVLFDGRFKGEDMGTLVSDANESYHRGQTVRVVFWGANPRNDLQIQQTFLQVERKTQNGWEVIASDWDPETSYVWERRGVSLSRITVDWTIPHDAVTGEYRIRHFGHEKSLWTRQVTPYRGTSSVFEVR